MSIILIFKIWMHNTARLKYLINLPLPQPPEFDPSNPECSISEHEDHFVQLNTN